MEGLGEEKFVNLWPVEARTETVHSSKEQEAPGTDVGELQLESEPEARKSGPVARPARQISYEMYESELQMPAIMRLMKTALSEPYSIYTYRYFIHNWPQLCVLAKCGDVCVGAIVCKLEMHHYNTRRGYIAMLAVDECYRKRKIGKG